MKKYRIQQKTERRISAGLRLALVALLGKTLAVISGTMTALTVAGWAITRANEKREQE